MFEHWWSPKRVGIVTVELLKRSDDVVGVERIDGFGVCTRHPNSFARFTMTFNADLGMVGEAMTIVSALWIIPAFSDAISSTVPPRNSV